MTGAALCLTVAGAKRIGTGPSALHSTFCIEEVKQNCFVFDAAMFKPRGSLAE